MIFQNLKALLVAKNYRPSKLGAPNNEIFHKARGENIPSAIS